MRLIGIYGGTFDPIHIGHLRPVLEASHQLAFDHIRFVPCYQTVHKQQPHVSAQQRCDMVKLAIAGYKQFELDLFEIEQQGPSYMVETLAVKKQQFPDDSLVLIMGTDAFAKFCSWHQWQHILNLANILILHRPTDAVAFSGQEAQLWQQYAVTEFSEPFGQLKEMAVTQLDISSTQIRQLVQQGEAADFLVTETVADYIQQQQLYQR